MNSFIGLCRREWLEHRGGFLWAPASVAAVIVVAVVLVLIVGHLDMARVDLDLDLGEAAGSDVEVRIEGEDTSILDLVNAWLANSEWTNEELSTHLSGLLRGVAEPFHYVYFIVLVFVLLGALHDDRKDRTVLFWKPMPVTDAETVLSKLVTAVWIAPAATIAMILAVQVFLLTIISGLVVARETLSIWPVWSNSGLFIGLVELLVGYLMQGLVGFASLRLAAVHFRRSQPFALPLGAVRARRAGGARSLGRPDIRGAQFHPRPPRLQGRCRGARATTTPSFTHPPDSQTASACSLPSSFGRASPSEPRSSQAPCICAAPETRPEA